VLNPRVQTVVIDGALYQSEVESRQIMAVPTVYLNGELFGSGRMDVAEIVAKLDTALRSATPPSSTPKSLTTC
jgi:Alkyl hydroperoxide reductase, large subunit